MNLSQPIRSRHHARHCDTRVKRAVPRSHPRQVRHRNQRYRQSNSLFISVILTAPRDQHCGIQLQQ